MRGAGSSNDADKQRKPCSLKATGSQIARLWIYGTPIWVLRYG